MARPRQQPEFDPYAILGALEPVVSIARASTEEPATDAFASAFRMAAVNAFM